MLAFSFGAVVGGSGKSGPTRGQLDAARASYSQTTTQLGQAQAQAASAKADAARAEQVAQQTADQRVADKMSALKAQAAALDAREKKVSGLEAAAKANTFDGSDATYLVGSDIKAGTYRGTASDNCYYARLSSVNTQDIIENNNTSGPVVVRILASDKAFQVTRCGTFTRLGD